ncbi:DinB family protein [Nocardia sp. NBC_01329]|uniref:DinB family protein n=1 Tax=Nocardia sp. NBC_01329 TaxID=2903594 RepID=UPI002E151E19|nr:DinB family protein [Nocardia sp. NBC_01329]
MTGAPMAVDREREDLVQLLDEQREMFRIALRGIDDEQARRRTTASELTLGGLLHHIIRCERTWTKVLVERDENAEQKLEDYADEYTIGEDETVAGLLAEWERVAARTTELVRSVDDLNVSIPTPTNPWVPGRVWWSARFLILHILREIAHHSGHADIIREQLDGANTTAQRAG